MDSTFQNGLHKEGQLSLAQCGDFQLKVLSRSMSRSQSCQEACQDLSLVNMHVKISCLSPITNAFVNNTFVFVVMYSHKHASLQGCISDFQLFLDLFGPCFCC